MTLADDIQAALAAPKSGQCRICWHLKGMKDADHQAVTHGLKNLSTRKIAAIMTNNGYQTSPTGVRQHLSHTRQEPTTA